MKPQAYLTHEDQTQIAAYARQLRAEATAQAFSALGNWIRTHLTWGSAHKA